MLCVLPFCQTDIELAKRLLQWIIDLGGCKGHDCLMVFDYSTPHAEASKVHQLAVQAFAKVDAITNTGPVAGWIPGSVSLFKAAAVWSAGQPFLWLEPDATPLCKGWLDKIDEERSTTGKRFIGSLIEHKQADCPSPYMEGVAVYPPDAWSLMEPSFRADVSWVYACAQAVVPRAHNSPLFQSVWGNAYDKPPTFEDKGIPGTTIGGLDLLRPGAVIFHRCKDGSLIDQLRKRDNLETHQSRAIIPCFNFCKKDRHLLLDSLRWMEQMGGKNDRKCVLHYEMDAMPKGDTAQIKDQLKKCFEQVIVSKHPPNPTEFNGWPAGPNWGFRHAVKFMAQFNQPWFYFEADCVAMRPDWLTLLDEEYRRGGKPFMGCFVGGMSHFNGTAVYPANVEQLAPASVTCRVEAFDIAIQRQAMPLCHRADHVIFHCRALINHKFVDIHGHVPEFKCEEDVLAIPSTVAVFHPNKNGSLIGWLRKMTRK